MIIRSLSVHIFNKTESEKVLKKKSCYEKKNILLMIYIYFIYIGTLNYTFILYAP